MKMSRKLEEYIKRAPHHYFFGSLVDSDTELEFMEDFADTTVKLLKRASVRKATKRRKLNDALKAIGGDVERLYGDLYPELVYGAFVISCVIFLERNLKSFAHALNVACELGLELDDLSDSLWNRFRKYSEKIAKVNLRIDEEIWSDLKGVIEIRNCLVHHGGNLDQFGKKDMITNFIEKHRAPNMRDSWIVVNERTARTVLGIIRKFTEKIYYAAMENFPEDKDALPNREKDKR